MLCVIIITMELLKYTRLKLIRMSWFGFGGGSGSSEKDGKISTFSETSTFDNNNLGNTSFPTNGKVESFSSHKLEEELMREQEKVAVQQLLLKLTDITMEQCVTNPSSSFSSTEQRCIVGIVNKYFESAEFVVSRVAPSRSG